MHLSPLSYLLLYCVAFAIFLALQQHLVATGMHPIHLNAYIYGLSALFFTMYLLLRKPAVLVIHSRPGIILSVTIALIASVLADLAVLYGLKTGSPLTWSLLICLTPLATYLLATVYVGDTLTTKKLSAVALSIMGAAVVAYLPGVGLDFVHGAPLFVLAIVLFSIANTLTQLVFRYVTPLQLTWIKLVTAAIALLGLSRWFPIGTASINWSLILLNALVLLAGNILVNQVIQMAGATYFAIGINITPLFVAVLAIFTTNTWPTSMQLIGGLVIMAGVLLFQKNEIA